MEHPSAKRCGVAFELGDDDPRPALGRVRVLPQPSDAAAGKDHQYPQDDHQSLEGHLGGIITANRRTFEQSNGEGRSSELEFQVCTASFCGLVVRMFCGSLLRTAFFFAVTPRSLLSAPHVLALREEFLSCGLSPENVYKSLSAVSITIWQVKLDILTDLSFGRTPCVRQLPVEHWQRRPWE